MTTEAEFRAKHEARVVEAMADAFYAEGLSAFMGFSFSWAQAPEDVRETARRCARAALAAYQSAMWMPIEEAEAMEATPVVLVSYQVNGQVFHALAFHARYVTGRKAWETEEDETEIAPTHCMPLPEPPEEG